MARRRFFVDSIHGGAAELRGDDVLHLTRVLRAEAGQQYEVSDGRQAYLAEIEEARGDRVVFRVVAPVDSPALPVRRIRNRATNPAIFGTKASRAPAPA